MKRIIPDIKENLLFKRLAIILALIVMACVPTIYFVLSYQNHISALNTETEITAEIVTEFINKNSKIWFVMEERLADLLTRKKPENTSADKRLIQGINNEIIFQEFRNLSLPVIKSTSPIYDSGVIVGQLEIIRSVRHVYNQSFLFLLFGIFLGSLVYLIVNAPLKKIRTIFNALENQKEKLSTTLASIGDGVISTDMEGKIQVCNKQAELITGFSADEIIDTNINIFFKNILLNPAENRSNFLPRALWKEDIVSIFDDIKVTSKDNITKSIKISGAAINGPANEKIGAVFILHDITLQKRDEKELRKIHQLETLGVFAGGLAHDFNNILTVINNNVNRVILHSSLNKIDQDILSKVQNAIVQAKDLTAQLLTFAKGGSPIVGVTSIKEIVNQSAEFVMRGSGINITYDIPDNIWNVKADSNQISQVVQNLVINSRQAIGESGGRIKVKLKNIENMASNSENISECCNFVEVSITDTGRGIPEQYLNDIFDPYFTTKINGSGLGLSVCYSIIKKHNGTILCASTKGQGSTFTFRIPATTESVDIIENQNQPPIHGSGHILVMDDDLILLESVSNSLNDLGYTVKTATDGAAAINYYIAAADAGNKFDVVILDLTIKGKMGGRKAIENIVEFDPTVKAIVSSGYSNDHVVANYDKYGFSGILNKPYSIYQLSKIVNDLILLQKTNVSTSSTLIDSDVHRELSPLTVKKDQNVILPSSIIPGECEIDTLKKTLAEQTLYSAKAEISSLSMHNIRNTLTPIFLDLQKLRKNLDEIDLSSCQLVKNELSGTDLLEDRKQQLIKYLLLSHEHFDSKIQTLSSIIDSFITKINDINKIIGTQDTFLMQNDGLSQFEIKSVFEESLTLFRKDFLEGITFEFDPNLSTIHEIMSQKLVLVQIVHKVIRNSIESVHKNYTEHGLISFSASFENNENQQLVHLQINDNGVGIRSEDIDRIFEQGFSTKDEPGRGNGLYFCTMCITALGGQVSAESKGVGMGATFHIIVPYDFSE